MIDQIHPNTSDICYWGHTMDQASLKLCHGDRKNYVCPQCCHERCRVMYPAMYRGCAADGWPVWAPMDDMPAGAGLTPNQTTIPLPLVTANSVNAESRFGLGDVLIGLIRIPFGAVAIPVVLVVLLCLVPFEMVAFVMFVPLAALVLSRQQLRRHQWMRTFPWSLREIPHRIKAIWEWVWCQ